jgi:hypothetical protein
MSARVGLAILVAAATVSLVGCSGGGGLGLSNQVIVHLDQDPNDLEAAQRVADQRCRIAGRRARLILKIYDSTSPRDGRDPRPPDAVFACDPAT